MTPRDIIVHINNIKEVNYTNYIKFLPKVFNSNIIIRKQSGKYRMQYTLQDCWPRLQRKGPQTIKMVMASTLDSKKSKIMHRICVGPWLENNKTKQKSNKRHFGDQMGKWMWTIYEIIFLN